MNARVDHLLDDVLSLTPEERSAVAASEIERLAGDIEVQSKQVQGAVTQGLANLDRSTALTGEVESAIADTGRVVEAASQGIAGIAASVQEEKSASTEIAQSMERISAMSEEASAIAGATRQTAQQLEQLAARLTGTVGEFRFA
jgi:methyl-accepting chemotaxis protein